MKNWVLVLVLTLPLSTVSMDSDQVVAALNDLVDANPYAVLGDDPDTENSVDGEKSKKGKNRRRRAKQKFAPSVREEVKISVENEKAEEGEDVQADNEKEKRVAMNSEPTAKPKIRRWAAEHKRGKKESELVAQKDVVKDGKKEQDSDDEVSTIREKNVKGLYGEKELKEFDCERRKNLGEDDTEAHKKRIEEIKKGSQIQGLCNREDADKLKEAMQNGDLDRKKYHQRKALPPRFVLKAAIGRNQKQANISRHERRRTQELIDLLYKGNSGFVDEADRRKIRETLQEFETNINSATSSLSDEERAQILGQIQILQNNVSQQNTSNQTQNNTNPSMIISGRLLVGIIGTVCAAVCVWKFKVLKKMPNNMRRKLKNYHEVATRYVKQKCAKLIKKVHEQKPA